MIDVAGCRNLCTEVVLRSLVVAWYGKYHNIHYFEHWHSLLAYPRVIWCGNEKVSIESQVSFLRKENRKKRSLRLAFIAQIILSFGKY